MAQIFPGVTRRRAASLLFLIGMRVNNLLKLRSWVQVARAMPPMIAS